MNKPNIPNRSGHPLVTFLYCIPAIILLTAVVLLWRSHSGNNDRMERLSVQNQQLRQELAAAKAEIDQLNSGDSSKETKERLAATRTTPAPEAIKAETETLLLQEPTVEQTVEGLVVRFSFQPDADTELPATIALVTRVPESTDSKIVSFKTVGESGSSNIVTVVSPAGNLGMIEAPTSELGELTFELTVTAPVKATVRGSEGIIDFEIDITPEGCSVRRL